MRADGQIERHDELLASQYKLDNTNRQDATAKLSNFYSYIEEALRLYQGYYVPHPLDGFNGIFPFAWYLREGMKIDNTSIGVTYTIKDVQVDVNDNPTGYVTLEGGNSKTPSVYHRLKFRREDAVVFMHGFPRTFAQTYAFEPDGSGELSSQYAQAWRDTITWIVANKEPADLKGTKDQRKRFRQIKDYESDDSYTISYTGQWFDAVVQLDCWTKSNASAEKLIEWFEQFMELYRGVFRWNGVDKLIYRDRTSDELVTRWRDDIVNRTLRYNVRVENVISTVISKIRSIAATFSLMPSGVYWPTGVPWDDSWSQPTGTSDFIPIEVLDQQLQSGG